MARSLRIQSTAKPKSNLPCVHGLAAVLHLPRAGGALGDHVEHRLDVEPGLLAEMDALGEPLHEPGDADLVDHLGELARIRRTHQPAGAGVARRSPARPWRKASASPPHHDRQHAVLGARLAARDRRVEEAEALVLGGGVELAGDLGRGGGVIDEDGALAMPWKAPSGPERDLAQIVVVADAGEHDLLALGGLARRRGQRAAVLATPISRPWRAVRL